MRARARASVSVSVRDPEGAREMGIGHLISCGHVLPHPDLTHVRCTEESAVAVVMVVVGRW